MNFDSEAEKYLQRDLLRRVFCQKKKKRKAVQPQDAEISLQKLPTKKLNIKQSWKKKVGEKYSFETQKLSFRTSPTLNIGNTSLLSDLKLRITIYEKDADNKIIKKCVILKQN